MRKIPFAVVLTHEASLLGHSSASVIMLSFFLPTELPKAPRRGGMWAVKSPSRCGATHKNVRRRIRNEFE